MEVGGGVVTAGLNVAVHVAELLSVIRVEAEVPEQPPDQPLNVEPDCAEAVRVMLLPAT